MGRVSVSADSGREKISLRWVFFVVSVFVTMATVGESTNSKISSALAQSLKSDERPTVIVTFAAGTTDALKGVGSKSYASREERLNAVNKALVDNANKSQASVIEFLEEKQDADPTITWETKWIDNSLVIMNATTPVVEGVADFPEVGQIKADGIVATILG